MSWLGRSFSALRWVAALLCAGALVLLLRELRAFPWANPYIEKVVNAYSKQIDAAHEQRKYEQSERCAHDAREELGIAEKFARETDRVAVLMRAQAEAAAAHAAMLANFRSALTAPTLPGFNKVAARSEERRLLRCFYHGSDNIPPRPVCLRDDYIKGGTVFDRYYEQERKADLTVKLQRKAADEAKLAAAQARVTLEKHRIDGQRLTEGASNAKSLAEEKRGAALTASDIAQSVVEAVRQAVAVAESARQRIALFGTLAMVSALLSGVLTVLSIVFGSGKPDSFRSRVRACVQILRESRSRYEGFAIPGHGFRALSAFLYSSHKAEQVFGQVLADMQRDWCAAIDARRYADARAARWRGYADFFRTMAAQLVEDVLGWVIHLFWRIG